MKKITLFFALIFCAMSMQAARTFVDFEIDLTKDPVVLPDGVTGSGAKLNDAQHGWVDYTIGFKVDGPVKMTIGGCEYAGQTATVTSHKMGKVLATVDTKTPGCYHNGGVATWTYNANEADSLIVYLGQYCPYFKAEAVEAVSNFTVTYFDQNGTKLGEETVGANAAFTPAYTETNLTIAEGYAFRGWKKADGVKVAEGSVIDANLELYASVTEIEVAAPGKKFTYDLAKSTWYQEEHELITITNGSYHSNHGWHIKGTGTIELVVAGDATVQVANCAYSAEADITVTTKEGAAVTTFAAKAANDGDAITFEYTGVATTLVLTLADQAYIHNVTVINKAPEEPAPGAGSNIEMKLYATNFQDWEDVASSTTVFTKTVTTSGSNETLTFSLAEVQVDADGTNSKHTAEVITPGYAMAAKTATPYIETSVLANVTKVTYVHAATGGSRGWGLLAKTVDATEWDTLYSTYCNQAGSAVEVPVNMNNVVLRWYNLNGSQNAYMTEMAIYGNVQRNFTNFEIDMSASDYDPAVVPSNVTITGSYRGDSHGYNNFQAIIPVDGPVMITLGGCQFSSTKAIIKNQAGEELAALDVVTPGCYHNGGIVTWLYNKEEADVLTIVGAEYTPYLKVEACAYVPDYTITYYDQNGVELGKDIVAPGDKFAPKYTAADLTIAEGYAFRGWTNLSGVKIAEGSAITGDMKVYASVTEVEHAKVGKHYIYDMALASWYVEDHECINITNGAYYNNHGWKLNAGGTIELAVSEKAYIQVKNCAYSADAMIEATVKSTGNAITSFSALAAADGAATTFYYEGAADTIVLTMGDQAYIHGVSIYNVTEKVEKNANGYYVVTAGDAGALLLTLMQLQKGDKVFLPNGTYDLGEKVLTQISVDSVSIIGESMEGTIILNAPDASTESINNTATILLTGNYVYFQDLTLKNALDYYKANNGRAVTLQDKATGTICKNVRLLSYQDTYYSNKIGAVRYFEDGAIHGTVDYICGDGSVYFNRVELFCEARNSDGTGEDCITASNADASDKGYLFESCVIKSSCPTVSLSRSWNNAPQVVFLNTTLDYSAGNFGLYKEKDGVVSIDRWTITGMNNSLPTVFGEYNTMDVDGNVISPASHVLTFKGSSDKTVETILTAEQAANYSYANFFGEWNPAADTKQLELAYVVDDSGNITWDATDATLFLVTVDGVCDFATELPTIMKEGMTVRAANGRGGFGPAAVDKNAPTDLLQTILPQDEAVKRIENGQLVIIYKGVKYNVLGTVIK